MTQRFPRFYLLVAVVILAIFIFIHLTATDTSRPDQNSTSLSVQSQLPSRSTPHLAEMPPEINQSASTWMAASLQRNPFEGMDPKTVAENQPVPTGHPSYVKAKRMLDCQDILDASSDTASEVRPSSEEERETADARNKMFFDEVQKIRCKDAQPMDLATIEKLMAEAALTGDPGALTYKAIETLANEESIRSRALADINQPASEAAKVAAKDLVELAMTGNRSAIAYAYEVTATDRYGLRDPLASAAWKIVLAQSSLTNDFDPHNAQGLPPDTLSPTDREKVMVRAREIFNVCCTVKP